MTTELISSTGLIRSHCVSTRPRYKLLVPSSYGLLRYLRYPSRLLNSKHQGPPVQQAPCLSKQLGKPATKSIRYSFLFALSSAGLLSRLSGSPTLATPLVSIALLRSTQAFWRSPSARSNGGCWDIRSPTVKAMASLGASAKCFISASSLNRLARFLRFSSQSFSSSSARLCALLQSEELVSADGFFH